MISQGRMKEIIEFYALHGTKQTLNIFSIPEETLNRYKRQYKQKIGEINDRLGRLQDKFSETELDTLLTLDTSKPTRDQLKLTFDGEDFSFLVLSDTHIGSKYFLDNDLLSAFEEGKRQGCTTLLHSGDIIEGMSQRPGQIYELVDLGYAKQRDHAVQLLKEWGRETYFTLGNHDCWINSKAGMGIDIGEDIAYRVANTHYLGVHEGTIDVNGAQIMLWHGEDSSSYATSYRPQKLAEAISMTNSPDMLICGHTHKQCYLYDFNMHIISAGSIQHQSGFMRYKRLPAHVGFWIIKGKIKNGKITQITPTWYPL